MKKFLNNRGYCLEMKAFSAWKIYYSVTIERYQRNHLAANFFIRSSLTKSMKAMIWYVNMRRKYKHVRIRKSVKYLKSLLQIWRT